MLTITAPIKTVLNPDLAAADEAFARRIMANYDQMSEFITREDLFHVVTQPPEIFMLGDGGSSFLSETEVHNTQLKKVEIINNLVNRILVSADSHLTYQDEVYITNVLHKLGIRDERTFMKKVYELTEESKQTNKLIETYWNNFDELSQMVSFYRTQQKEGDTHITESSEEVLHLHEDVFNRWMTAAVYRMQNNFRTSQDGDTYIDGDSYRMTEEQRLSQQILLQRLREGVRGEAVPLVYRHENYYEQPGEDIAEAQTEAVATQIASAVLLNLVDNLYENIINKSQSVGDRFYHTEAAYYGAAEHVFERMEGNTAYLISTHRAGDVTVDVTERAGAEISAINQIIDQYYSGGDVFNEAPVDIPAPEAAEMILPIEGAGGDVINTEEIHVDERNSVEQQLYQMNLRNERRRMEHIQNLERISQEVTERTRESISDTKKREQSLMALSDPEELRRQFEESRGEELIIAPEYTEQYIESLPEKTREVLRIVDSYIKNPGRFYGTQLIQVGSDEQLLRESMEAEMGERLIYDRERIADTIERQTETERRVTERLQGVEETVGRVVPETVSLVHKVNDVTIDEQTIESLRNEIRRVQNDTSRLETKVDNRETVTETQVNNYNENVITEENTEQITRLIQQNLNQQIGFITGKVYDRLERQLQSERRRRGM